MKWTIEEEERFTKLKLRELDNQLSISEKDELEQLRTVVRDAEDTILTPTLDKLQQENANLQSLLIELTDENKELIALSKRQNRLIKKAKNWIADQRV